MIPKVIHYCWFGGKEKPDQVVRMIESWRKQCPDFQIKEWNEGNFDVRMNTYCREACEHKKWAFVSDVARLWALVHEGGIYMDTDVEVVRPLDPLLQHKAFVGFEGTQWIATSTIGTEPGNRFLADFLESYDRRRFVREDGTLEQTTNVEVLTARMREAYPIVMDGTRQQVGDFAVYPSEAFCPYDYINGRVSTTPRTYVIHWFAQTWIKRSKWRTGLSQLVHRLFGKKMK